MAALRNAFGDIASDESVQKLHETQIDGSQKTRVVPAVGGGLLVYKSIDLNNHGVNVKGHEGQVYGWFLFNRSNSIRYVKLYNKGGRPSVGSDTPYMTIPLPAGGGANVNFISGITFNHGIGIAATGGVADNDNTAPGAHEVIVNLIYF